MAATLRRSPSSERPAPRPVISTGARPSSTLATALAVVVLPMPISPVASRRTPFSFCVRTRLRARQNGLLRLGPRHGRPLCDIPRAVADAPGQHAGLRRKIPHAHVHGHHGALRGLRHPAHGGAPRSQVARHSGRHAAVRLGNALGDHAVVRAQHQHRTRQKRRLRVARQRRNVLQRRLQQTQAAQRLCARRPAAVRLFPRRLVRRRDVLQQFTQFHASSFFLCIPASFCFQCPGRFPKRTAPPRSRGLSKSTGPFTGRFERRRLHAQTAPPAAACPQNTGAGKLHTAPAPRTRTSSCGPSQASAR